jgi:hypothetical protein
MLKEIEKTFGRRILVDLVDMKTQMSPCIGFEGDRPAIQYVQMPFDKFGVKIMGTEPIDVVVRIDNKVVAQRARLEANAIHVISRGDDGKPFVFTRPGEKPKHVADDAGELIGSTEKRGDAQSEQLSLFPEAGAMQDDYDSHGLVVVQVRFAHVKPDFGPELPPDDFTNLLFQMCDMQTLTRHMLANLPRLARPEDPPAGFEGVLDAEGKPVGGYRPLPRVCSCASDRHGFLPHKH